MVHNPAGYCAMEDAPDLFFRNSSTEDLLAGYVRHGMDIKKYRRNIVYEFKRLKEQADRALVQVDDKRFHTQLSEVDNSIAVIVKHISGNMRSRWREFLTADGEKADRHRDTEFEIMGGDSRAELMKKWDHGWDLLLRTLENLTDRDMNATVLIRKEPFLVPEAIHRQLTHYASHVGQIIFLARHFAGEKWHTLSVPKGKSEEFNANPTNYLNGKS